MLMEREWDAALSPEKVEQFNQVLELEHILTLAKANARRILVRGKRQPGSNWLRRDA
jgi:hypothetical protein